ncbi:MAG: hypothetical protein H0U51_10775 [Propionibacteriales bacterium]|nr:hypothetical protein [Propionibacteriales bacterium]
MTQDDQGRPGPTRGQLPDDQWLTLTDAAARCGYTREALRQRVRRGSLRATKGNDGQLRVQARALADLPPPDMSGVDPGQDDNATLDVLASTVADLRTDLERTRTALDTALADRLADHGRAERAEAQATAEATRAVVAEARLAAAEAALAEARLPWVVRLMRAMRR